MSNAVGSNPEFIAVQTNDTASETASEISSQATGGSSTIDSQVTEVVARQLPQANQNQRSDRVYTCIAPATMFTVLSGAFFFAGSSKAFYTLGAVCATVASGMFCMMGWTYCAHRRQG